MNVSFGNLIRATGEINESIFPVRHMGRDYAIDSGGPGVGGAAAPAPCTRKQILAPSQVYTFVVGRKYPMPGIAGGMERRERRTSSALRVGSGRTSTRSKRRPSTSTTSPARAMPIATVAGAAGAIRSSAIRTSGARGRARRVRVDRRRGARLRRRPQRLARRSRPGSRSTAKRGASPSSRDARGMVRERAAAPQAALCESSAHRKSVMYRIGIDVGGTFTDLVLVSPGRIDRSREEPDDSPGSVARRANGESSQLAAARERSTAQQAAWRQTPERGPRYDHRRQYDDRDERGRDRV